MLGYHHLWVTFGNVNDEFLKDATPHTFHIPARSKLIQKCQNINHRREIFSFLALKIIPLKTWSSRCAQKGCRRRVNLRSINSVSCLMHDSLLSLWREAFTQTSKAFIVIKEWYFTRMMNFISYFNCKIPIVTVPFLPH